MCVKATRRIGEKNPNSVNIFLPTVFFNFKILRGKEINILKSMKRLNLPDNYRV